MTAAVHETVDKAAEARLRWRLRIEELFADYVQTIDDDRLEDWPGFFTEDGVYRIVTRENHAQGLPVSLIYCSGRGMLADRIAAMRTANIFEPHVYCHMTGGLQIRDVTDREARVQSNFTIIRTMADGAMSVFACGRYLDHIVDQSGALKFAKRDTILDSRRIDTLLVIPI